MQKRSYFAILLFYETGLDYSAFEKGLDMETMKSLFLKYKELILYVFFGGLTTLVNWGSYWVLADVFHVPYLWATAIAQILSILFAYVTNRVWVFESRAKGFTAVFWEMVRFFGCRGASFVLDLVCMRVGVGGLHINDKVMKLLSNVIVIIVNYVFSKVFVFRKPREKQGH